ncbi:hypothetical protein BJX61DRAFT_544045 [Aspergillus egyptiacus]|nr:hypothetical protein BJX61DRAFT_544045 [Aspergillus egyptiacus]
MTTHILDPDGEVFLILKNPNASFAVCEKDSQAPRPSTTNSSSSHDNPQNPNEKPETSEVRFRVSAKHLIMASPYFKSMLTGGWRESEEFRKSGTLDLSCEGWDAEALLILFRIFHGQTHDLPFRMSVERLARFTAVANYYNAHSATKFFTAIWAQPLETTKLRRTPREMVMALWVAWFLRRSRTFKRYSTALVQYSTEPITSLGLPLPDQILDTLNDRRIQEIERLRYSLKGT